MASLVPESLSRVFTPETLKSAAKQSQGICIVPIRLQRAIENFLREQDKPYMKTKVLKLSESFNEIKYVNLQLRASTSRQIVDDPREYREKSKRWKIESEYGDIGLRYADNETLAYVASRMPAVYSACHRVLSEVRRRLPGYSPAKVLDFGSGTGSVMWALQEVWPNSVKSINLVEPSQSMQRAGQSLLQGLKELPLIQSYGSIQALSKNLGKQEREHDLVIASYVLGEIPSLQDRITVVRQLWDLTRDVLVLIEPGTPHGSNIICQMRSHILWMSKRKTLKAEGTAKGVQDTSGSSLSSKNGAFVVAPCGHDGSCPLEGTGTYCHFVQRLQRTTLQRTYKRSKGSPLRGFEDEKFCFVVFKKGERPREPWPLDRVQLDTSREQRAKENLEDVVNDDDHQCLSDDEATFIAPRDDDSNVSESDTPLESADDEKQEADDDENEPKGNQQEEQSTADLGSGWGRIIFTPVRRGSRISMDVCRATKRDGSEGCFERVTITRSRHPILHHQARKSLWGDLWPL